MSGRRTGSPTADRRRRFLPFTGRVQRLPLNHRDHAATGSPRTVRTITGLRIPHARVGSTLARVPGLVVVTLLLAIGAVPAVGAEPAGARLLVNDSRAVGAVGDGVLSLAEAIQLIGGGLNMSSLSKGERRQVIGDPRTPRHKDVAVALRRASTIATDKPLPVLPGLTDTRISGAGRASCLERIARHRSSSPAPR